MNVPFAPLLVAASTLTSLAAPLSIFPEELDAWKMAGPGEFQIADNIATASGGMGLWWYSAKSYQSATFALRFKLDDPNQNSGVFIRFPDPGDDPWVAVRQGYEVQISGGETSNKSMGAIYDIQAPVSAPLKPAGQWNQLKIHTLKDEVAVVLNGELTNVFKPQKGRGDVQGYFGIQNHDDKSAVQFKDITILQRGSSTRLRDVVSKNQLVTYREKRNPRSTQNMEWYDAVDFGPAHIQTWADFHEGHYRPGAAIKGLLLRPALESPDMVALFNMETLQWVTASESGVSLDNTPWAGAHGTQNKVNNQKDALFSQSLAPAWADENGSREDLRETPGHGNFAHLHFNGYYRHGEQVLLDLDVKGQQLFTTLSLNSDAELETLFSFPPATQGDALVAEYLEHSTLPGKVVPFEPALLTGGPALFPETFTVTPTVAKGDGAFLVDQIPLPPVLEASPFKSKVRVTDFDFFADGDRAAICTWDGDVWLLSGLRDFKTLTWKRFASGLFEPLGLKIVDEVIHLNCRDGIWQIIDLNDDQEADHYQVFNNDVLITDNFHEFTFGLATDAEGNFYFAKASPVKAGGRNFDKIVKHNGTVMKLSPDGKDLSVVATGLRAPGGIGVGPNGEITTGENEGTWQPCCKLNYFTRAERPVFLGTEQARHDVTKDFHEPLCYLPMTVDNSSGGQVWVPDFAQIGLKAGELLHLSYGQSSVYRVLPQTLPSGQMQGGVVKLPIKLSSSAQRAAFHPDGSLYVCGMRSWQSNAAAEAGFQRVRHPENSLLNLPEEMTVTGDQLVIRFDCELDEELATDPESFAIKRWKYIRGPQYGSGHFSIDNPDVDAEAKALKQESKGHKRQDTVEVTAVSLGEDGRTLSLTIPSLKPAQQMQIAYDLESTDGEVLIGTIYSTIHEN